MHIVFSFLVLHITQLGTACRDFGRLSEGNYLCDSCSGQNETMGTSFCHSGPSRRSGGCNGSSGKLWAFPHVTWLGPVSTRVVNVQPCAGAKDTDVSKTQTPLPSRGNYVLGRDRCTGRLLQPSVVSAVMVWTQTRHVCVLLKIWRTCAHALGLKQQNTGT